VAPRHAEDIARTVGVSLSTVHRVSATYKQGGVAAIETAGKGGRRHQHLTLHQERAFLQPFLARAAQGERASAAEIQRACEVQIGHAINKSTIYRLLDRHGWQQLGAQASSAQANVDKLARSATVPVRERMEQQSPSKANRALSAQRYPSDLRDQEWAILEPLIPPGFARGASSKRRHA